MTFSLATVRIAGVPVPVIESGGTHVRLDALVPGLFSSRPDRGLLNLFDDWAASERLLLEAAARVPAATHGVVHPSVDDFMTPLQYPAKLILGGANYYEHMFRDAGKPDFRKEDGTPVFFLKPPTTTLVGCGPVRFPSQSAQFDWEIELAVIFGRRMRRVSEAQALEGVAGYAVGIDLSARDWQMNPRHPWKFDLFTGKAFDDACPLGPKIVPARFVDTRDLRLTLTVNGETRQDASTSDMIWSVAEQASLLSEFVTIEPGDVLLTGTPAGVGLASGTYLKIGDRIEATISGLGTMRVMVVPDSPSSGTPRPG